MINDARGATTIEKKIEVAKDCQKWAKQKILQQLLARAHRLVAIRNQIPIFILIEVFDNSRVKCRYNKVDI